jgi:hypothetical protein
MNRLRIALSPYLYPMKREALNVPLLAKNIAREERILQFIETGYKESPLEKIISSRGLSITLRTQNFIT